MGEIALCFVCLGNICRSPTAEGVMLHLVKQAGLDERIRVDSAGTAAYHVGERPDPRTLRTARARGVALPSIARRFVADDFSRFDYVLAMDRDNQHNLERLASDRAARGKIHLLRSFEHGASGHGLFEGGELDVPDPYYGGEDGFERVFDICEAACEGLLSHLKRTHGF
jgi:protein-tyrosine phosphatase